ncbi:MAG TPA: DUF4272 domain-containing protein [Candidatus Saccharimonadales bacterium]|nr:DUF4272 domain-containing protein [Candidatus Saccharimonadales bacterium]
MFSNFFNKNSNKQVKEKIFGEYFSSKAPNNKIISFRALCLGALLLRNEFEMYKKDRINNPILPITDDFSVKLDDWCTKEGLNDYFSNREKELLTKPLENWTDQEIINTSWSSQALGILLWSLSYYESIPLFPKAFTLSENLISKLHVLHDTKDFFEKARLRNVKEIRMERDNAEHWHWRSRTYSLIKQGKKAPEGLTWDKIISVSANGGYKDGSNPQPIDNDFPVANKAFRDLTLHEYQLMASIIQERHFAFNWLCGYSKNWDDTPTDT